MAITAEDVRKLRETTGAGLMDCKKALEATSGDIEAAVDHLRKQGLKTAEKKAGREAGDGRVYAWIADDGRSGSMVALRCETDFVARTEDFESFLQGLCAHVAERRPGSVDEMLGQPYGPSEAPVSEAIKQLVGKLGENIQLADAAFLECADGKVGCYIHHDQKKGALVAVGGATQGGEDDLKTLGMHVVFHAPTAMTREEVPATAIEREKAIYLEEVKGKPAEIQDKIVAGKLDKYFAQVVLPEQPWVKDDKLSTAKAVQQTFGKDAAITGFAHFVVGS